ncbi:hypothetical protein L195_g047133, partial [Trifolium pratense]
GTGLGARLCARRRPPCVRCNEKKQDGGVLLVAARGAVGFFLDVRGFLWVISKVGEVICNTLLTLID